MTRSNVIIRAASFLVPVEQRARWVEEWRSELWYVPREEATAFCLGAFRDALWLRRNNPTPAHPLASPLSCIAVIAALSAVCGLAATRLEKLLSVPASNTSSFAGIVTILLLYAALAAFALAIERQSGTARPSTLRAWSFLALKIVLALPVMQCGLILTILCAPVPAGAVFVGACIIAFRWIFADQRRRCPVCLRLLTRPVRIGSPSDTFLEWYGAESLCSLGHGLLHAPENSASYCGGQQWVRLDGSWRGLFSDAAGVRK